MAHTITGKLNKSANQFQAGESTGFNVRLGVKYYNRETKQDDWTNYSAVIFSKNPNQVAYLQQVLVEGAIVSVSGDNQRIDQYQGNNGLSLTIELLNARLEYAYNPAGQAQYQQNNQQAQQRQGYGQPAPQYQQPQQYAAPQPQMSQQPQYNQQQPVPPRGR